MMQANRIRPRVLMLSVVWPAVLLTGCGDDAADYSSSNRGSGTDTTMATVENAYVVPRSSPGNCAIQAGDSAELSFTATNNRSAESERLLQVTTESADAVRISPMAQPEIPPRSSIAAGQPIQQPGGTGSDEPFRVTVEGLDETVKPGMAINVTFRFEKSGEMTLAVPIEACPRQIDRSGGNNR